MYKTTFLFLIAILLAAGAGQVTASDKTDVMKAVNQFVDAFNKGDTKTAAAACADQTSIIDEFPPHEWHGTGACSTWMSDYDADAKKNGITDPSVTLNAARHVDVTGDRAYIVVPANYIYKMNGKPMKEVGSILTIALQKVSTDWKITAWSWAKH